MINLLLFELKQIQKNLSLLYRYLSFLILTQTQL